MINKSFHNLLKGVSVLPALLIAPAFADAPEIGFIGDYISSLANQMHDVFSNQNATGFEIGKITIGNDTSSIGDGGIKYGIATNDDATQSVRMEQFALPAGMGDLYMGVPLDPGPNMKDRGLNTQKLSVMVLFMGQDILPDDGSVVYEPETLTARVLSDGQVNVKLEDISALVPLVSSDAEAAMANVDNAMENGKIEDGYLYTNNNFVIDGNYGNMIDAFVSNYRDSVVEKFEDFNDYLSGYADNSYSPGKVVKGILGFQISDLTVLTPEARASAVDSYLTEVKTILGDLDSLKLKIGEVEMNGGSVTFANNVGITTSKLEVKNGASVVFDSNSNTDITIDDVSITYTGQYSAETPISSTVNYTGDGLYVSGANTNVTIDSGAGLTVAGNKLDVSNGAVLINNGTLNINTTNATFGEDITGNGTLVVGENTVLNIGTNNIVQGGITLNGTMNAIVRDSDDAQLIASVFDGTGTLNLAFANEGTYHVFGDSVFSANGTNISGIDVNSALYNLNWINEGKDLEVTLKQLPDISTDNGISGGAATTVAGLAGSSSSALNDLAVTIQEKLAEGTPEAIHDVEQAASSINPETESVSKMVASSIQNTVANLANSRLAMSGIGRSAGDSDYQLGGVWIHGLYNKTKMNDRFSGYTHGFAAGLDGKLSEDVTVGMGYAFNDSDVTTNGQDMDVDSHTFFVYGQYKPSGWFASTVMNYTWSRYSEKGYSSLVPMTNEYDADSFGAALAGGYDFDFGLTLGMGLRYLHINGETYADSLGISKKFDAIDYLTPIFGAKWGLGFAINEYSSIRPELRYALKYDVLSDATVATVAMPGTVAYTLVGDRLPRVGNEFGLGLTMKYYSMALSLSYDIEIRPDYTSQTGMARLRYTF